MLAAVWRTPDVKRDPVQRLRELCLALPEATEKEAWGTPTFRVREKIFAMVDDHHHGQERLAVWCKAPPGVQEILINADPKHYFRPPYVGPNGWVGVRIDLPIDWAEIEDLVTQSYRMTAPKRLLALLDGEKEPEKPTPKARTTSRRPRPKAGERHAK